MELAAAYARREVDAVLPYKIRSVEDASKQLDLATVGSCEGGVSEEEYGEEILGYHG